METGSTNEVHFCEKCHNLSYLHLWKTDEDSEETLVYYCKACGNKEDVSQDSRCMYTLNFGEYDKSEYLNANKYITHDITIPSIEGNTNIVCPNAECVSVKENRSSSVKYIKYDSESMRYLYICKYCGQKWRNH